MIRTIPWVLLLVVATATTNSFAQELLQDPSFDATDVTAQTNPFWTLDVNFPGDGAEPAARYQDAPWASNPAGVAGIGIWNRAFDGTLDNPAEAAIFQNVPGSAGVQYRASGFYRRELHFTSLATVLGMNFMQGDTILETAVHDLGSAP
ncbi:MAG: hypothetical protein KDA60_18415, partial [Planctomycetales bacterium]|nr:hypothetical protein [Planctomycetales bacterium]